MVRIISFIKLLKGGERMKKKKRKSKIDIFFQKMARLGLALAYSDVRMKTKYSEILPSEADLTTRFSRRINLKNPLVSAAMDTVTESKMAIEMAKLGGLGIIHCGRGITAKEQSAEVDKVKFYLNGLIKKPITVKDNETIEEILNRVEEKGFSFRSFPVLNSAGKIVGVISKSDFEFCRNPSLRAKDLMSKNLIKAPSNISIEKAFDLMCRNKKKVLPLINHKGIMAGMYVFADLKRIIEGSSIGYTLDENGNLRVGAAVSTGEEAVERAGMLASKGVDVIVLDTAHGDSSRVIQTLKEIKKLYPHIDVITGNVSEPESAKRLAKAGADGIKVGQGPGSICTTRMIAGVGCPQITAVYNCAKAVKGMGIPICADGGIEYSGDIGIAIGLGAESVMMGFMLSGTLETPGEVIMTENGPVKEYRGMGSLSAMKESFNARKRYGQTNVKKLVAEGVATRVPYKGKVFKVIEQLVGGLRATMGYVGAKDIKELQKKADIFRITSKGMAESHPRVDITEEAPNYKK
jgi:IMP dehydrogenase